MEKVPRYVLDEAKYLTEFEPKSNKIIWMSPQRFLEELAVPLPSYDEASLKDLKEKLLKGTPLDPLWVDVEAKSCRVVKHEGRHRARAAIELGISDVPVLVYCRGDREFLPYEKCAPCEKKGYKRQGTR